MVYCLLIPFLGTVLGSCFIYFMFCKMNKNIEVLTLGLAAGIMMAASIWSLIIPSIDLGNVFKTSIGLILGVIFFLIIDKLFIHKNVDKLMMAVNIHNIPEGMAVGVLIASYKLGIIDFIPCLVLSIGIALQNIPEGFIVSFNQYKNTNNKNKAFLYGIISALFELLGAIVTLIFTGVVEVLLPYLLAFSAGAMFYVIVLELIPESVNDSKYSIVGYIIGFIIMMILDCLL